MFTLWIIVFIALVYWIVRVTNQSRNQLSSQSESAIDILKKRYARGEITREQFEKMKKDL